MISFTYGINVSVPTFDRFIFLPENSTHILQPLDVAVFAPMKKRWRALITEWKDECSRNGTNYATIPKQVILRTGTVKFTIGTVLYRYYTIPYKNRYRTFQYTDTGNGYCYSFLDNKIFFETPTYSGLSSAAVNPAGKGFWGISPQWF
jgi:hypothetical protein